MKEKSRTQLRPALAGGPGAGLFDDEPAAAGLATVTHGAYAEQLPVAEMTVAEVRQRFRDRLDIHPQALALIDANFVDDSTRVRAGQLLTFVRPSGEKGRAS